MRRNVQRGFSIPSEPWENVSLAPHFVIVTLLLLGSMAWALWDEVYTRRPWKGYQKEFRQLARHKYESDLRAAKGALLSDAYIELKKKHKEATRRYENHPEVKRARKEVDELDDQLKQVRGELQGIRGEYQALIYVATRSNESKRHRLEEQIREMEPKVNDLLGKMQGLQDQKREQQNKLIELAKERTEVEKKMAVFETAKRDAQLGLEGIEQEKTKVRQVFNEELGIVDRCQSCHVAVGKKGFDKKFAQPFRSHPDVFFIPAVESAPSEGQKAAETNEKPKPPRLQNILDVHSVEQFGCATCHRGQGFAVSSEKDAHGELEYVLTPMLRGDRAQATCLKCHTQETELKGAPVLNEGRRLAVEYGCIGCHKIAQLTPEEANRQIGPDLKEIRKKVISPEWIVNWIENPKNFRPTTKMPHFMLNRDQATQVAAYLWQHADKPATGTPPSPSFPPNAVKAGDDLVESVGCLACHAMYGKKDEATFAPDLSRIGEKMRSDYMVSWLMDPKKHQPLGRMPKLRLTQLEASNVAAYLTTKTKKPISPLQPNLDDSKLAAQGEILIKHYGCAGCHNIPGIESTKIGTELSDWGAKPVERLDYGLQEEKVLHQVGLHHARDNVALARIAFVEKKLDDPRSYDKGLIKEFKDRLRMPRFGFNKKQIHAIVTFLLGLTDEKIPPQWQNRLDEREGAIAKGLRLIRRQNCIGCHQFQLETLTFKRPDEETTEPLTHFLQGVTTIQEEGNTYFQLWKDARGLTDGNAASTIEVKGNEILNRTKGLGGDIVPLVIKWAKEKELATEDEEARPFTPPILVGEGNKVQSPWLFNFLKEPIPLRPWLKVRMPTFELSDEDAAALTRFFAAADGASYPYRRVEEREPSYIARQRQSLAGYYDKSRQLVEQECSACHVRGSKTPEGRPPSDWAPDLSLSRERLQPDWILAWLKNPQTLYPGTKMPTFPFADIESTLPPDPDVRMKALKDLLMSGQLSGPTVAAR
jgi:mono/diheme cytochrome c family protein